MLKYQILLPTQLYDIKYLDKSLKYYLYEHSLYFNKYQYNKKKIILHKASLLYYYDYLTLNGFNVKYIKEFNSLNLSENIYMFDPIDVLPNNDCTLLENPNFILSKNELYASYDKMPSFKSLYNNLFKPKINYLQNINSTDKNNRGKYDYKVKTNNLPLLSDQDKKYIDKAIKWTNKYYSYNLGNCDNFIYPVTHKSARRWMMHFLNNNFEYFGKYQDSIDTTEKYLFHSLFSILLNIGLLNVNDVVNIIIKKYNHITINSREGFIRQLCWREYIRASTYYLFNMDTFFNENYFNNNNSLKNEWYEGKTNIKPVDDAIAISIDTGWTHHIIRLMVLGNYMLLQEIKPYDVFNWFMEMYCDAYEWVMMGNIVMSTFHHGRGLMKKPYFSSSNYILTHSNYKKDNWCITWNKLYKKFLYKHQHKLIQYGYRIK